MLAEAASPESALSVFSFTLQVPPEVRLARVSPCPRARGHQQVKGLDCGLRGLVKHGQGLVAGRTSPREPAEVAQVLHPAAGSSGQGILGHSSGSRCLPPGPAEATSGLAPGGPSVVLSTEPCALYTSLKGTGDPCRLCYKTTWPRGPVLSSALGRHVTDPPWT